MAPGKRGTRSSVHAAYRVGGKPGEGPGLSARAESGALASGWQGSTRVARRCAGDCLAGAARLQMRGGAPRSKQLAQGHKPSFPSPDEKLSILEERVGMSNCPRQSLQGDYIPAHLGGTAHPLSRIWFCAQPRDHALRRPGPGKPGMHLSDTRERKRAHSRLRPLVP